MLLDACLTQLRSDARTCNAVIPSSSQYVASMSLDSNSFSMAGTSPILAICIMSVSGFVSLSWLLPRDPISIFELI